jgi:DNA-binding protein H-NS
MASYKDLKAQAEALMKQAEEMRLQETSAAIADIKAKMELYGLTVRDLGGSGGDSKSPTKRKKRTDSGSPLPAKYKDGNGNAWSGRGIKPKWLQEALGHGKKIEDFAV